MKKKLFQVDFNPWHYICNMSCCYCIKHIPFLRQDSRIYIKRGDTEQYLCSVDQMMNRAKRCLENLFSEYEVSIITFSGSETFLFPEIIEVIEYAATKACYVQLITNGTLLSKEMIRVLECISGNIQISLSLDGCTLETNFARTLNDSKSFESIIKTLGLLTQSTLKFDVLTVLSKYNISHIGEFLSFLEAKMPQMGVQMWPVFGTNNIGITNQDVRYIDQLIEKYNSYNLRMQPLSYFLEMRKYLLSGKRILPCVLSKYCAYLNDVGDMKVCPCNGLKKMKNIFTGEEYVDSYIKFYGKNTLSTMPCKKCFINWEVVNLYLADRVDLQDLIKMPLFSTPNVKKELINLRLSHEEDCKNEA